VKTLWLNQTRQNAHTEGSGRRGGRLGTDECREGAFSGRQIFRDGKGMLQKKEKATERDRERASEQAGERESKREKDEVGQRQPVIDHRRDQAIDLLYRDTGKCSYERPTRGTVCGTMRSMCGADAGCLAINYQSLYRGTSPIRKRPTS